MPAYRSASGYPGNGGNSSKGRSSSPVTSAVEKSGTKSSLLLTGEAEVWLVSLFSLLSPKYTLSALISIATRLLPSLSVYLRLSSRPSTVIREPLEKYRVTNSAVERQAVTSKKSVSRSPFPFLKFLWQAIEKLVTDILLWVVRSSGSCVSLQVMVILFNIVINLFLFYFAFSKLICSTFSHRLGNS